MKDGEGGEAWLILACLNPCYNGIKMKDAELGTRCRIFQCLNPCYNGIKMKETWFKKRRLSRHVLILVIME